MASPVNESTATQAGLGLSFAAIVFNCGSGWVAASADYYVYFPVETPSWQIFLMAATGMWILPAFAITCGAGFASTLWSNAEWAAALADSDGSSATLIEFVPRPLESVRYFFLFVLAINMISNNVFNLYSIGISM
jgi:purine-cytosine permease-like protein